MMNNLRQEKIVNITPYVTCVKLNIFLVNQQKSTCHI